MLCSYGCGRESVVQFKSGKHCCSSRGDQCPAVIRRRVETRRAAGEWHSQATKQKIKDTNTGKELSAETKAKISRSSKGRKRGPCSEECKRKLSEAKKGSIPWNKGLTSVDPRVAAYAAKQTGQIRTGDYVANRDWAGNNNPWHGKNRSGSNSPRWLGEKHKREFTDYRNKVAYLTEQTYIANKDTINPSNKPRTIAGEVGGHHLDHIFPVSVGYSNNVPCELLANINNLRLVPWRENIIKSDSLPEEIPEVIKEYLNKVNITL